DGIRDGHVTGVQTCALPILVQNVLDGRDAELLRQDTPLTAAEEAMLIEVITRQREPSVIDALVALLKAGRGPRRILDAIQVAAEIGRASCRERGEDAAVGES